LKKKGLELSWEMGKIEVFYTLRVQTDVEFLLGDNKEDGSRKPIFSE
jgi:hypothetical protein